MTTVEPRASINPFALRDACPCAECRHPTSGQRLYETGDVVRNARIVSLDQVGQALVVGWADGHVSLFPEGAPAEAPRRPAAVTWGTELAGRLPSWQFDELVCDLRARREWLAAVAAFGVALIHGAPCEEGAVTRVVELFGYVRVTNYGRLFDVRVRVDASNLADTSLGLSLHTDNPYRDPAPTLQLLHCLASTAAGGDTLIADGFRAVEALRKRSPEQLVRLASTDVPFAYRDRTSELAHSVPIVQLDRSGRPVALHVNNRSKGVPTGPPAEVGAWYEAYFALLDLLEHDEALVRLRLEPGDVILFDNLRVLHGRTAFAGVGERHLQGCYADRDGLFSSLAVLDREEAF